MVSGATAGRDADALTASLQSVVEHVDIVASNTEDALGDWQLGQKHERATCVAHLAW